MYSEKFSMREAGHAARGFMRRIQIQYWVLRRKTEKKRTLEITRYKQQRTIKGI